MFPNFAPAQVLAFQFENFTCATRDSFMQLRALCDSVWQAYLFKVADTVGKRNYLYVSWAAIERLSSLQFLDAYLTNLPSVLDLHPSDFQACENLRVFLVDTYKSHLWGYLISFLRDPARSGAFYYDPEPWNAFVATRYMRYLRVGSGSGSLG